MKQSLFFSIAFLAVGALAAIPTIRITTQNGKDVTEKSYYVMNMELQDPNNPANNISKTGNVDSIKVRGNSTASQAKRPYRIKFDKKTSLFGKTKAKSWVLLANFYDTTLVMNAVAFELGKRLGLEFTNSYEFVDVYINNNYKGIYILTEQLQVGEGRVNIDKNNGFLIEFDYHGAEAGDVRFQHTYTDANGKKDSLGTFIKSPEDLPDQSGYQFVKDDLKQLTDAMFASSFPENGYRNLIDIQSMASYVMIQTLMDNFDFNSQTQTGFLPGSNFCFKEAGGIIYAGPLWDFDLSAGVNFTFVPVHFATTTHTIKPTHSYYLRFFDDPVFLAKWKKTWDANQDNFKAIPNLIDSLANYIEPSITQNFEAVSGYGGWGAPSSLTLEQYKNNYISKYKNWWNERLAFFGSEMDKLNIDVSKDKETPSFTPLPSAISIRTVLAGQYSGIFVSQNVVKVITAAPSDVKISVFDLRGKKLFSKNSNTATLDNKGVYFVTAEAKTKKGKVQKFFGKVVVK